MTRDDIVVQARKWVGTPYHHQGRVLGVGVDCVGLLVGVARAFGVPVHDERGYTPLPHFHRLEAALAAHCAKAKQPGAGDLVLLTFRGQPTHCGVDCGETLVHAYTGVGRCVEHHWNYRWRSRVAQRYVLPGLEG